MKAAAKGILLSVSQMIVILALVLVPFTGAIDENVTAGNTTDGVWSIISDESSVASLGDSPTTWTVHPTDKSANFRTIQSAIDNSNVAYGDSIEVWNGTYNESVVLDKRLTLYSRDGANVTIVDAQGSGNALTIKADSCTVNGFMATGSGHYPGDAGIKVESNGNNIVNNICCANNYNGIRLSDSSNNMISSNTCVVNNNDGISLYNSSNNTISNNNASSNFIGIALSGSRENTIINNTANSNSYAGFAFFDSSDNNTITDNMATDNPIGLTFRSCGGSFNTISNNHFDRNYDGISILGLDGPSDNNVIVNNSATYNDDVGLYIINSSGNIIENNNFSYTEWYSGIELRGISSNNKINNNVANSNGGAGINLLQSNFPGSPSNNTITNNSACFNKYSGIQLTDSASHNTITNNSVSFNNASGIALFRSCGSNIISNNELYSNLIGLSIKGADISNNQIVNNTVSLSNSYGIWLADLQYTNAITNNNVSESNLFGIFVLNSTNNSISDNTANLNERGIGLKESSEIRLINNSAESNEIAGFSLINSTNNILVNNSARFNTYEGIHLSNSRLNKISNNNVSSSYFGISVYSSNENEIINNAAELNYYFDVFLYSSTGNNITNNTWYTQEDIIRGVRLYLPETLTPSLQTAEPATNATYYMIVENLGNMRDTYDLDISSIDNPGVLCLDKDIVTLDAGEISAHILSGRKFETIKLNVSDTEPGIYRAKVEVISRNDNTVRDAIETQTIVQGTVDTEPINASITNSALIKSAINNSIINRSAIINSIISDSTINDSIINNSTVIDTSLNGVVVEGAIINAGNISAGTITLNGIRYEIDKGTPISDLVLGADYSDSTLVGIKNEKTLKVPAENTNVSFDIYAKKDYFAGSLSVQKSSIPPNGIPEFTNNVGGYVYANASENLNNSKSWVNISVNYNQNELGALDESSLKLRYFNETADAPGWEDIPISGINHRENYVWGNISHFSIFALASVDGGRDGGICPLPDEIIIDIANWGTNTFLLECLGHDITRVLIDLKSMKINAKVALKKVDKPVEFPDPPGIVYGYFDISTNIEPEKIRSSKIHFKILKSWTVFNDINVETIKLWRYAKGWEELETAKIKEDDNHLHFCAETKCFSLIAITSEKRALDVTPTAPALTAPALTAPVPTAPVPTAPRPTPIPTPTPPSESPVPSLTPLLPTMGIKLLIIAAIAASALIVSVTYLLLRRRKKKLP